MIIALKIVARDEPLLRMTPKIRVARSLDNLTT